MEWKRRLVLWGYNKVHNFVYYMLVLVIVLFFRLIRSQLTHLIQCLAIVHLHPSSTTAQCSMECPVPVNPLTAYVCRVAIVVHSILTHTDIRLRVQIIRDINIILKALAMESCQLGCSHFYYHIFLTFPKLNC